MSDIDPQLKAVLAERGEGVHVVAGLVERAIARDRSNRHRELGVAALGAGLVLAVAVPLTWSAAGINRSSPLPIGPTQPTTGPTTLTSTSPSTPPSTIGRTPNGSSNPTAIPTLRSTGAPGAAELQPATGPVTGTTDVGYVVDGVFHEGTRTITLPSAFKRPDPVATLGDGLLVSAGDRTAVLGSDGQVVRDLPPLGVPVWIVSDRSHALVTDRGGNLLYLDSTGKQVARLPAPQGEDPGWQTAGLVGETAYAVGSQGRSVAWNVRTGATTTIQGAIGPIDATGNRAIIRPPNPAFGQPYLGCQRLVDLASNRTVWNLCGPLWFTSFSADGAFLLGHGSSDGQPPGLGRGPDNKPLYQEFVVARTSDAQVVLQSGGDGSRATGFVTAARFGGDGSITAQVTRADGRRALQRCSIEGRCEVVGTARPPWESDVPESVGPFMLTQD